MADGMQVGGLASGLDTTSIINGLIQIETQRVTREEAKKAAIQDKQTTFNDLKTKLSDFYAKAQDMNKTTALNVFKNSSSDPTVALISAGDAATPGNYDVKVLGLASSLKVASKAYATATTAVGAGAAGSFKISVSAAALKADPTVTDVQIDLLSTDTIKDIASKINRAKGVGVSATVLQMGTTDFRLMLSAVDEGTRAFTLTPITAGVINSAAGLDLISTTKATRADFDMKLAAGGPVTTATTFNQMYTGLGPTTAITNGDTISWTGTNSAGVAVPLTTFTIGNVATDNVQGLMTAIQTSYGAGHTVTLNSSGEIVIKGTTTTADIVLNLTFNDANPSGSQLAMGGSKIANDFRNLISDGKKAFYLMNGMSVSSYTNRDDGLVTGTTFELKKVDTTNSIKLTLDYDKDGIKKKVQDFLDTYNQVIKFLDEKSKIEVKKTDDKNAIPGQKGKTTIVKGPFAGDSSVLGLKSQLRGMMTSKIQELDDMSLSKFSSLASMGITSEQKTGFLTIDDTKFKAALDKDFEGVKRVFATNGYTSNSAQTFGTYTKDTKTGIYNIDRAGVNNLIDTDKTLAGITFVTSTLTGGTADIMNSPSGDSMGLAVQAAAGSGTGTVTFVRGVAGQIKDFYEKITNYVDGFVTTTVKGYSDRIKDEDTKIDRLNKQVATVKDRLTKQFANLELSISKLQSQSAAFSGQMKR